MTARAAHENAKYVTRYAYRILQNNGPQANYMFLLTTEKRVCDTDNECQFYLKVGAILDLGEPVYNCLYIRQLFDNMQAPQDNYGNYILMFDASRYTGSADKQLSLVWNRYRPQLQPLSNGSRFSIERSARGPAPFASIIPRYDINKDKKNVVICGMRVDNTQDRSRKWRRFRDENGNHAGFTEIYSGHNYGDDIVGERKRANKYIGFYVGECTALIMMDNMAATYNHNRTLFQSGAFVYVDADQILFRYHNDPDQYPEKTEQQLSTYSFASALRYDASVRNPILFLQSTPALLPWCLGIVQSPAQPNKTIVFTPPSGAQLEKCLEWEAGIEIVKQRQSEQPWRHYISLVTEDRFENSINSNHIYPNTTAVAGNIPALYDRCDDIIKNQINRDTRRENGNRKRNRSRRNNRNSKKQRRE